MQPVKLANRTLNILIVEDDITIADLLAEAVEAEGHIVIGVARTVREALRLADLYPPDVAIIDLHLANGDLGTEVAAHLSKTTRAKILFSSGNSCDPALANSGGDAVLTKPYRIEDIGRALNLLDQMAPDGRSDLILPRNFRFLSAAGSVPDCRRVQAEI